MVDYHSQLNLIPMKMVTSFNLNRFVSISKFVKKDIKPVSIFCQVCYMY